MNYSVLELPDAKGGSNNPQRSMKLSDPVPKPEEHKIVFPHHPSDFFSIGTEGPYSNVH